MNKQLKLVENAGQWWKSDVMAVFEEFVRNGGEPNVSDAHTINGQPGDLYPCSGPGIYNYFASLRSMLF